MRTFLVLGFSLVIACGGRQEPKCFECGLTREWAVEEAVEEEPKAAETPVEAPRNKVEETKKTEPTKVPVQPEQYHGCGFPSTAENPDPCGSTSGGIRARVFREPPGLGVGKPEHGSYENVTDDPDYCGTPGCGQKHKPLGPIKDTKIPTRRKSPL